MSAELGRWVLTHAGLLTVEEAGQLRPEELRDAVDVMLSSCACNGAVRCTAHRLSPPKPPAVPSCKWEGHESLVCRKCRDERIRMVKAIADINEESRAEASLRHGILIGASLVALAGWVQRVESTCDDCGHEPGTHWDGVCWALPGMACDCRARSE